MIRPALEGGALGRADARVPVCWKVVEGRHLALFRHVSDFLALALLGGDAIPLGKIEMAAALPDVVVNHPRERRDAAVPGPDRLVRMAVVAGAAQDGGD